MKFYPKTELKMKDGLIVNNGGDVVLVDPKVVDLANCLETKLQEARYLAAQPECQAAPSLIGFQRKSNNDIEMFTCDTPIADARAKESLAFMDELDDVKLTYDANRMLNAMKELVLFVKDTEVLGVEGSQIHRFDTPELGDPLTWTEDTICKAVAEILGCTVCDDEEAETDGE